MQPAELVKVFKKAIQVEAEVAKSNYTQVGSIRSSAFPNCSKLLL